MQHKNTLEGWANIILGNPYVDNDLIYNLLINVLSTITREELENFQEITGFSHKMTHIELFDVLKNKLRV